MAIVKSVMKGNLKTAQCSESVAEAAKRMKEHKLGALLVEEGAALVGIFTERDLLNRVVAEGKDPLTTTVGEVSTQNPVVVKESAPIKQCASILKDQGFRHLPVVNEDGVHVGIVSSRDFFLYMADELEQVIDKARRSGEPVDADLDIYEILGGGGYGIPQ